MTIATPDDPFAIKHKKFFVQEGHTPNSELVPGCNNVKFSVYDGCDDKLVGRYGYILESVATLRGISNIAMLVYPGTIADINNNELVFAVFGNCAFVPGIIYENCNNRSGFREVTASAYAIHCLLSIKRLRKGELWAPPREVVDVAKEIFGQEAADEIKIFFEVF